MVILTTIFHLVSGKGKGEKGGFKGKGGKDYYSHKALERGLRGLVWWAVPASTGNELTSYA